jgi:TolA-binding protein
MTTPEHIVEALRADPPVLDDLRRTRLERAVLAARHQDASATEPPPRSRWGPALSGAAFAAATVATLSWWVMSDPMTSAPSAAGGADVAVPSSLVAEGMPAQGETLRTGAGQRVRARIGATEVGLEPNTRAQFERIAQEELRVRLRQGALRVSYRPQANGQRMVVMTPAARVEVVGTVFRVEVDGTHATGVWVERGEVRVVPLHSADGEPRHLRTGESTRVEPTGTVSVDVVDALVEDGASDTQAAPGADEPRAGEGGDEARPQSQEADAPPTASRRTRASAKDARRPVRGRVTLPGEPSSPRFDRARRLLNQRKYEAARKHLRGMTDAKTESRTNRTRAWIMIAESYEEQGQHGNAAEAYGKAAWFGSGTAAGQRALFRLGQVREGRLSDARGARNAYRRYLRQFPQGPDAPAARRALCRLGEC